ncbi:MAG: BMP family ABC transporter substrate-binding protein [Anaerovoracaceae bacterium]|jgi:basic membrane protein A|nr:BMP family ABC transporter substrate-binding protein [Anaerovoracaceae bacterium]
MKKIVFFLVCALILLGIIACDGIAEPVEEGPLFVLLVDEQGLVEEGYNDLAWQGFQKAEADFGVRIEIIEAESSEDYLPNIKQAVEMGASLVVCNGSSMIGALQEAANEYPSQAFAIIDGKVEASNVSCYTFTEEGAAFLAGVGAAAMSETDIIGFVWDIQNQETEKYQYAFEAGVESANVASQVLINYTNLPDQELLCKETALAQNKLGVDVIFHGPGSCGRGVIEASLDQNFWVIGIDKGQSILSPDNLLAVIVKAFDLASYMAIENFENGVSFGAQYNFSLADGGIDLVDLPGNLTVEATATINNWKQKIIDLNIAVPYDASTFAQFFMEQLMIEE